jgi:hypothetical protein
MHLRKDLYACHLQDRKADRAAIYGKVWEVLYGLQKWLSISLLSEPTISDLSRVQRTWAECLTMAATDPKRT